MEKDHLWRRQTGMAVVLFAIMLVVGACLYGVAQCFNGEFKQKEHRVTTGGESVSPEKNRFKIGRRLFESRAIEKAAKKIESLAESAEMPLSRLLFVVTLCFILMTACFVGWLSMGFASSFFMGKSPRSSALIGLGVALTLAVGMFLCFMYPSQESHAVALLVKGKEYVKRYRVGAG